MSGQIIPLKVDVSRRCVYYWNGRRRRRCMTNRKRFLIASLSSVYNKMCLWHATQSDRNILNVIAFSCCVMFGLINACGTHSSTRWLQSSATGHHPQDPTVLSRDCDIVFCSLCVSMGSRSGNKSSFFLYFRFLMPVEGQSLPPFYLFFCVFPSSFFHIILSREQCALTIWKEAIRWEGGKRERKRTVGGATTGGCN